MSPDAGSSGTPGALLVGGAHGSLAVARSLGRRGIPVYFLSDDHPITKLSRYTRRSWSWGGPGQAGAVDYLVELAHRFRIEGSVLFAGGDPEVRLFSHAHARLASVFRLTTPPWEIARWAYDKHLMHERAAAIGVDCPWTYCPRDRRDVAEVACRFPIILKPVARESRNRFTSAKAWRVDGRAALIAAYDEAVALVGPDRVMLQELIPGNGTAQFSYAAVWRGGAPVASVVARRSRQYPIDFGFTSTFVETIENDAVEDAACRFLSSLAFDGIVEVEFKHDRRDGRYKILDVNVRPWAWIALGAAAGVDFPFIAWQVALGRIPALGRGRAGLAWMHTARDLIASAHEMLAGGLSPRDYLGSLRLLAVFAAFALDDPLPGILELPIVMSRVLGRRASGVARWRRSVGLRLEERPAPAAAPSPASTGPAASAKNRGRDDQIDRLKSAAGVGPPPCLPAATKALSAEAGTGSA